MFRTQTGRFGAVAAISLLLASPTLAEDVQASAVLTNYANIALAGYEDALITARTLDAAIGDFLAEPNEIRLQAARDAWIAARAPYQQTEAYRFGNSVVDDWEGRVNAWPLDEGLIDYVSATYGVESDDNPLFTANVIANSTISVNGESVDVSIITPDVISGTLQEAGDIEANVASGYHAIEFMLWGQDLNGNGPGAGQRPATDFSTSECTNGNCDRRRDYLASASQLLIADLEEMVANWQSNGAARAEASASGLNAILTGMGSLSYGELAGERMKLGLLLHDSEEEHDCFSDNTHNSHFYDAKGIQNVYLGSYTRVDGTVVEGPSLSDYVAAIDGDLDNEMRSKLATTMSEMGDMVANAEAGEAYDQMIGEGNVAGNALVQEAIDALIDQTRSIERVVAALGLDGVSIEGSDSLDSPNAIFQ